MTRSCCRDRFRRGASRRGFWGTAGPSGLGRRLVRIVGLIALAATWLLVPSSAFAATGWSSPTSIDVANPPTSVSCPSSSFCAAVGFNGYAQTFNGSSWSAPAKIDSTPDVFDITSVSCTSSSFCAAVDLPGYALTYNGSSWSSPVQIDTTGNSLISVSCASSSFCIAGDAGGNGFTYSGGAWSGPATVNHASNEEYIAAVSCPSSSFCAAVGLAGYAETFNGSSWSAPVQVDTTDNSLSSVSCASPLFCVAADSSGNTYTYNGSSWSAPVAIDPSARSGTDSSSVSCASSSFCAAIDGLMDAMTFDGSAWTAPLDIEPDSSLKPSVSCPSSTFCVAVDGAGNAFTYNTGPSAPTVAPGTPTVKGSAGAGFSGSVDPEGLSTTAYFQYGLDPRYSGGGAVAYDESTPAQQVGSDFSSHAVSASASGLVPNALYHVRLLAANGDGTTDGPDQTFTTAEDPPPPPPVLGKKANFAPVSGTVYVKPPSRAKIAGFETNLTAHAVAALTKGVGFIPLTEARQLPVGTEVAARGGTLNVTTATAASKKGRRTQTQTGEFSEGLFEVLQSDNRRLKGLTVLTLLDSGTLPGAPSYKTECAVVGTTTSVPGGENRDVELKRHKLSKKVLQTLKASEHGNYQTRGRYSAATVRGTIFTVTDRCDGTLTVVKRGVVVVTDFRRRKNITLRTGQSYLAEAP